MLLLGVGDFARWVSMETDGRQEDAAGYRSRLRQAGGGTVPRPVAAVQPRLDSPPPLVDLDQHTTVQLLRAQRLPRLRPPRTNSPADDQRVLPDSLDAPDERGADQG
jgi:hypothetical protein